jgi:protease secretion system outer membrane protein
MIAYTFLPRNLHDIAGYFTRVGNFPAPINTARAKKQESLQQLE